jgi:hypothetical protein
MAACRLTRLSVTRLRDSVEAVTASSHRSEGDRKGSSIPSDDGKRELPFDSPGNPNISSPA